MAKTNCERYVNHMLIQQAVRLGHYCGVKLPLSSVAAIRQNQTKVGHRRVVSRIRGAARFHGARRVATSLSSRAASALRILTLRGKR